MLDCIKMAAQHIKTEANKNKQNKVEQKHWKLAISSTLEIESLIEFELYYL